MYFRRILCDKTCKIPPVQAHTFIKKIMKSKFYKNQGSSRLKIIASVVKRVYSVLEIRRSNVFVLLALLAYSSCHSQADSQLDSPENCCPEEVVIGEIMEGKGSYYGPKFHGKRTANGEKMDKFALTCAHKTLPFGTMLEVTNLANGKRVIVRVNDRGPFSGSRILDISLEAAKRINMISSGVQRLKVMVVGCCGETYLNTSPAAEDSSATPEELTIIRD